MCLSLFIVQVKQRSFKFSPYCFILYIILCFSTWGLGVEDNEVVIFVCCLHMFLYNIIYIKLMLALGFKFNIKFSSWYEIYVYLLQNVSYNILIKKVIVDNFYKLFYFLWRILIFNLILEKCWLWSLLLIIWVYN